jgi:3'-5' exoribonuclease
MKKQYAGSMKAGDKADDIFVLYEKTVSQKKDGSDYLNVTLSDKSGRIRGVVWDNVARMAAEAVLGGHVHVRGSVSEYKGVLQVVIKSMDNVAPDKVDPSDFLPATGRDVETMFRQLAEISDSIKEKKLRELFTAFWNDRDFTDKFKKAPAAKKMHHAFIGGLLEHTLSMARLADRIAGHYEGIDRDLLIAGTILHDIGKIREFEFDSKIDYSDEGRLLSHIVIGLGMIDEKIKKDVVDFPETLVLMLKHMIVSHHGTRDFGSPEPPKTVEAVLLNYIDEIDSKVTGIREFIKSGDGGGNWTSYHKILERHFYTGENGMPPKEEKRLE